MYRFPQINNLVGSQILTFSSEYSISLAALKFHFHSLVMRADLKLLCCLIHCADCMQVCNDKHM